MSFENPNPNTDATPEADEIDDGSIDSLSGPFAERVRMTFNSEQRSLLEEKIIAPFRLAKNVLDSIPEPVVSEIIQDLTDYFDETDLAVQEGKGEKIADKINSL
jgi:hypothetical protein